MTAIAAMQWGCSANPMDRRVLEIDQVEDQVVRAVDPLTGRSLTLERRRISPRFREGDVLVDGRSDPVLAAELRAGVARARAALGTPGAGSFNLEDPPSIGAGGSASLTERPEP